MAIIPGWQDLVVCGVSKGAEVSNTAYYEPCNFWHLIQVAKNAITDITLLATLVVVPAAFMYIGFKLLTSRGNPRAMEESKAIFSKVVIGFLWILGAWLLVYTIASAILDEKYLFLLKQ